MAKKIQPLIHKKKQHKNKDKEAYTMTKYTEHFLLDTNSVKDYVIHKLHYFDMDDELEAVELSDGNINYVFKVSNPKSNKSIVIKQADKFLRSSGRPLDVYRNKIEAEILKIERQYASDYVPEVYAYDDMMCILAMEDISEYKNMRKELMEGKSFPHFADTIADFLARTLLPTTDLVLERGQKKENVKLFTNKELCDITEDLVLTEPYDDYKKRNIVLPENKEFVEKFLYHNEPLKVEVGELRNNFMNQAQALLHGDLHSGSIFINEKGIKIIDPEFAFYGPIGYDIGNVIGNLFFAWANKLYTDKDNKHFLTWIERTIADTIDHTMEKIDKSYDQLVLFDLYKAKAYKQKYLANILADALGYAGTEIIRRVVGDSKVLEVTSLDDMRVRVPMERVLIKMGIYLILHRRDNQSGQQVTNEFNLIAS